MKIIIDEAIPYLRGVLEPYAETVYLPGRAIAPGDVHDADALVIRTRTRCDAALLDGSRVRFIATATIGFDHIDLDYCRERRIDVATAAGCNARGVLQWMGAVLHHLAVQGGWNPPEKSLGIVGAGHVGELVRQYAAAWGFRVVACDPPRAAREGGDFVDLGTLVRQSDLIAFHTPLDAATRHMVDAALLEAMKPEAIVINASRGEVVDGTALLRLWPGTFPFSRRTISSRRSCPWTCSQTVSTSRRSFLLLARREDRISSIAIPFAA